MQIAVPLVLPTHPKDHSYKINYQYVEKELERKHERGREGGVLWTPGESPLVIPSDCI